MKKSGLSVFVPWFLLAILFLFAMNLLNWNITYASPYTDTNVDTAYNMITNGSYPNLVVLDVRRQDEYDSGHIHGAVLIPHTELDGRIEELADHENHEIIVYCRTGVRSVIASEILDSHNFTEVYNMLGGIQAWQSAGYPVWTREEDAFWMQLWFWAIVGATVVIAMTGAVYILKKRKQPATTPLPPENTHAHASVTRLF
jgi:rhodanese-related sulfurtransferase